MTKARYLVALSRALHSLQMGHELYSVLAALSEAKREGRRLTRNELCEELGISYNGVVHHFGRAGAKSAHLFVERPAANTKTKAIEVTLSRKGLLLIRKVEQLVQKYSESRPLRSPQ